MAFETTHPEVLDAVCRALAEDVGSGDVTSRLTVPLATRAEGGFFAKEELILAGVEILPVIYEQVGGVEKIVIDLPSGTRVPAGIRVAQVRGPARALLMAERTALNFMQRLSGIATLARRFVDATAGTKCKVLDTRKTSPGLRRLEKMAAAAGGVTNHRMGLFDAILIKNNHIAAAGGVKKALRLAKGHGMEVEIEVRTLDQLDEALAGGADRVLLDNLSPEEARRWIERVNGRAKVEISGGVTLETVRAYAETGADFVSSGAITHSARAMDLNFLLRLLPQ